LLIRRQLRARLGGAGRVLCRHR